MVQQLIIETLANYEGLPDMKYMTEGASGFDVYAAVAKSAPVLIKPFEIAKISAGFCCKLEEGWELQVRPRSGLATKHGVTIVNSPGTIDSDYRGEIFIALINLGRQEFVVKRGMRIAQIVPSMVNRVELCYGKVEIDSNRGKGGFGSTGGY